MITGLAMPVRALASPDIIRCEPALKMLCANIHVGCAGRSRIPAHGFEITFVPSSPAVMVDDGSEWTARISSEDDRHAVLRRMASRDWIRIDKQTAAYVQRIYVRGKALMTRGLCRLSEAPQIP